MNNKKMTRAGLRLPWLLLAVAGMRQWLDQDSVTPTKRVILSQQSQGEAESSAAARVGTTGSWNIANETTTTMAAATQHFEYFLQNASTLLEDLLPLNGNFSVTTPPAPCGFYKCYFASQHFPDYGYTIGQSKYALNRYVVQPYDHENGIYNAPKRLIAF